MDTSFIAERITQLRLLHDISEHRMSLELGMGHSYVHAITSGKSLPSMDTFLRICEYFHISPRDFFDDSIHDPDLVCEAQAEIRRLSRRDLRAFIYLLRRFNENQ